jgi:hypothetical protein
MRDSNRTPLQTGTTRKGRARPVVFCLMLFSSLAVAGDSWRDLDDVLGLYGQKVERRLQPRFQFADLQWPPREVSLVAFKDTRLLELWARNEGEWVHIKDYRIKGMSGKKGPKLKEGDRQVPEGFYQIEALNPNSSFHLSLKLDYPNAFDREQANREGRTNLGGDIFIHGDRVSSGCLAMGDNAVEELFVLTALLGLENVSVLISPRDFRFRPNDKWASDMPGWVLGLNERIAADLRQFPLERKKAIVNRFNTL